MMDASKGEFIKLVNKHIRIAHKVSMLYGKGLDEIKHDASDPRRDDYNTCEDSMWQLKDNYKHMKRKNCFRK